MRLACSGRLASLTVFTGLFIAGCIKSEPAPLQQQHTVQLCLRPEEWPNAVSVIEGFGHRHGLCYHGEIIPALPSASGNTRYRILNAVLFKGRHQFGEDDFDLWLTSSPNDET